MNHAKISSSAFTSGMGRTVFFVQPKPQNLPLELSLWISKIKFSQGLQQCPNLFNLVAQTVLGNGDCLFEAIAVSTPSIKTAQQIRELAVEQIGKDRQLQDRIKLLVSTHKNNLLTRAGETKYYRVEEYLILMQQAQTWGTEIELLALARSLHRPVIIITPNNIHDQIIEEAEFRNAEPIFLNYINPGQYQALVVPADQSGIDILGNIQKAIETRPRERSNAITEQSFLACDMHEITPQTNRIV